MDICGKALQESDLQLFRELLQSLNLRGNGSWHCVMNVMIKGTFLVGVALGSFHVTPPKAMHGIALHAHWKPYADDYIHRDSLGKALLSLTSSPADCTKMIVLILGQYCALSKINFAFLASSQRIIDMLVWLRI